VIRPCHQSYTLQTFLHPTTGDWRLDMKSGTGTMRYANGNQYDGEWSEDAKSGYGVMEWKTLNQRYEGQWAQNKPHGES